MTTTLGPPPDRSTGTGGAGALGGHVAFGVRWGLFNQIVQQVTRFGVQVVLTRLLAPEEFGVMAVATVLVSFGTLLSGLGFSQALIQRATITRAQVAAALGGSLAFGVLLAAAAFVGADAFAAYFDEPKVASMVRVLSVVFVFQSLEGVPNSLLRRHFLFRHYVLSSTIGVVVGAAVGVALAVLDAGVWALVAFSVTEAFVATALGWVFATRAGVWRPSISLRLGHLRELLSYSSAVTGSRLLAFALRNVDNIIVARVLGTVALGYYGLAYRLLLFPLQRFTEVIANVTLPAFARMQADRNRLGDAFLRAVRVLAAVLTPLTLGIATAAPLLVPVVFGDRWAPAADSVRILCLSGPALAVSRLNSNLYEATGRASWTLLTGLAGFVLLTPAFLIGVQHGITGVAWAYTIATYLGIVPALFLVRRCTGLSVQRQLRNVSGVFVASGALVVVATGAGRAMSIGGRAGELGAMAAAGAMAYVAALALVDRELVLDTAHQLLSGPRPPRPSATASPEDDTVAEPGARMSATAHRKASPHHAKDARVDDPMAPSSAGPSGARWAVELRAVPATAIRDVQARYQVTCNDVYVAMVAAGVRDLIVSRDHSLDRPVIGMVPPNARSAEERPAGSDTRMMFVDLHVHEPDDRARLARIHEATVQAEASAASQDVHGHHWDVVITTAMPAMERAVAGRPVVRGPVLTPLSRNNRLAVVEIRALEQTQLTFTADGDALPDLAVLADGTLAGLQRLLYSEE